VTSDEDKPTPHDMDERVAIPLDPEDALKGLLKVDPDAPVDPDKLAQSDKSPGK
jgi:hypothetical protein